MFSGLSVSRSTWVISASSPLVQMTICWSTSSTRAPSQLPFVPGRRDGFLVSRPYPSQSGQTWTVLSVAAFESRMSGQTSLIPIARSFCGP